MENILLVLNIVLAIILVLLILVQKSEGGALGIGVSQDNFMFSRTAGNFMTKATAFVATLFIICSLALTIISRGELTPTTSVLDKIEEKSDDTPKIPENNN
ncbi:preprotein translocase subunit SecG [Candidatus Pelagibacter sp.]|jgi:preprotein translocase subunit SecG|nr:preprotein translocase subunit SecG [Candidatus Pelagibacter sp.]|tara:strand:- start:63 stop:365 length:303 start_codon:yes stop_codon:yes gene_type:complete